jgi:mono/diheme cytochrome c family protein
VKKPLAAGSVFAVGGPVAAATLALALSAGAAAPTAGPTFAKDVAPVLYKHCVECHRAGEFAPMPLVKYEDVRPWAKSIRERVVAREMPPWSADPRYGKFKNDPRLSEQEIETISRWVAAGAPKGDLKDLPATPKFAEGWTIGEPDAVFTMQETHKIPAEGTVPYLYFSIPTHLTEDKWVQAYEIRPGNRAVVHHVIASAQPSGGNAADERTPGRIGLGGVTPNKPGVVLPTGIARRLRAGSEIIFQMHYTTNGMETTDRTSIGLIYAKQPPTRMTRGNNVLNAGFLIPAGAANHEVRASRTFNEDTTVVDMTPHMHMRGKDMTYTVTYPDGRSEILLSVPKWDFNWQITYHLEQPKLLPKGTKLDVVAHFDNSRGNLFNPDPGRDVRWGDQTWEEMMMGFYTTLLDVKDAAAVAPTGSDR